MKKMNIIKIALPALSLFALAGCSDWVTPEAEVYDEYSTTEIAKDDAYYEALRAYKASDHSVAFGWYDGWGEPGVSTANMLSSVPDSMDIISLWGGYTGMTKGQLEDLKYVTEVKGTKVTLCSFIASIGQFYTPAEHSGSEAEIEAFWGWKDGDDEAIHNAIKKWTKAISDSLDLYGLSGVDIDYEPAEYGGKLCRNSQYFTWFVEEMGKYIGPQSGTDKIFILDGYLESIPNKDILHKYFDYYVTQSYTWGSTSGDSMLEERLNKYYNSYSAYYTLEEFTNKLIVTDNLESAIDCLNGGYLWICEEMGNQIWDKDIMPGLVGFANWKPDNGFRKGGFGAYKFSGERSNNPPYKWMRKAIQQQNPSPGYKVITLDDFVADDGKAGSITRN